MNTKKTNSKYIGHYRGFDIFEDAFGYIANLSGYKNSRYRLECRKGNPYFAEAIKVEIAYWYGEPKTYKFKWRIYERKHKTSSARR
jgi:hypothetical protein